MEVDYLWPNTSKKIQDRVTAVQVEGPTLPPVTTEYFKAHARVTIPGLDAVIPQQILAAAQLIEKATGCCMMQQQWKDVHRYVSTSRFQLIRRPVLSVDSIETYANYDDNTPATMASSGYYVLGLHTKGPSAPQFAAVRSKTGSWPDQRGEDSLVVTYTCGFTPNEEGGDPVADPEQYVPESLRQAVCIMTTYLLENPGDETKLEASMDRLRVRSLPPEIQNFLSAYVDRRYILT